MTGNDWYADATPTRVAVVGPSGRTWSARVPQHWQSTNEQLAAVWACALAAEGDRINVDPQFILHQINKPKRDAGDLAKLLWYAASCKKLHFRWVAGINNPADRPSRDDAAPLFQYPWSWLAREASEAVDPAYSPRLLSALRTTMKAY